MISASTPFVIKEPRARLLISEILPLITEKLMSFSNLFDVSVLSLEAPVPTGSKRVGWFNSFDLSPAKNMDSMVLLFRVPILMFRPEQILVISSTSS